MVLYLMYCYMILGWIFFVDNLCGNFLPVEESQIVNIE